MKILYAIQGTGNGHVSRAREIIPYLKRYGDVDILLSGNNVHLNLPFGIKYRSTGISYHYGTNGKIDLLASFKKFTPVKVIKELLNFPIQQYDLIINDYEFISSWAAWLANKRFVSFGHQPAYLSPKTPMPEKQSLIGNIVLKYHIRQSNPIGLHFERYDDFIYTPIIRSQIRNLDVTDGEHYTVYLSSFGDEELFNQLGKINDAKWEVFSIRAKQKYTRENVTFFPANNEDFLNSVASCKGLLTGAGFETPAETLYLGKKLFCIPINMQYEQYCNGVALEKLGVPVVYSKDESLSAKLEKWINEPWNIKVNYPDNAGMLVEKIVSENEAVAPCATVPAY
ncbi:MAG: glycosyltransferase family protein [Bacteroidia bacterium]